MANRQIHLMFSPELIEKIEEVATESFMSRSEFIKQAVLDKRGTSRMAGNVGQYGVEQPNTD